MRGELVLPSASLSNGAMSDKCGEMYRKSLHLPRVHFAGNLNTMQQTVYSVLNIEYYIVCMVMNQALGLK